MDFIRCSRAKRQIRRSHALVIVCGRAICLLACTLPACSALPVLAQTVMASHEEASLGSVRGTVIDPNGNFVAGAQVRLLRDGQSDLAVVSDANGQFLFVNIAPGGFALVFAFEGFASRQIDGVLQAGETLDEPPIALSVATATTEVRVVVTNLELAEEQLKVEEAQRVVGVFPNFYVTYQHDALPLSSKQKFELAWKSLIDPVNFAATGAAAGIEQATDSFRGYGQGAQGYSKRYGAAYADGFIGDMIGGAILPSLLKQDPRYFYKGTGSKTSRFFYAIANSVICKGDNGRWQPDYSGVLGSLAAGGISNVYYPSSSRSGAQLTFENTFIGIGGSAVGNILQEFLIRKLTPHSHNP